MDFTGSQQHLHTHCTVSTVLYFIFLQFYASPELSVIWLGSSSSPCKSVVLWSRGLHEWCMTQRCMAQQCMTVWSLECDLTLATTTLVLTQITQSPSSAVQQLSSSASPAQMWPVLTAPSLDTAPASTGSARHPVHR